MAEIKKKSHLRTWTRRSFLATAGVVGGGLALTLQNLVEMKEWIARELNVIPNEASRIETALLFVRAGGDFTTWTIGLEDVFRLIVGQRPSIDAIVTPGLMNLAREHSNWTM